MSRISLACCVLVLCGLTEAQSPNDHVEVFGGFSFVSSDFTGIHLVGTTYLPKGWNGSATFKHGRIFGLTADASGYYPRYSDKFGVTGSANTLSFLFGPQISYPSSKVSPFAHALLGFTHVSYPPTSGCVSCRTSANSFAVAIGGGIDIFLARHLGIRGQADLFHNGFSSSDNQLEPNFHETNARISSGILIRF